MFLIKDTIPSLFIPQCLKLHSGLVLYCGFWQTEKYFLDIEHEVREAFTFNPKLLSQQTKQFEVQIRNTNSVSVHIRRGDFLTRENIFLYGNICCLDYYKKAIEKMVGIVPLSRFFVFSNDVDWCKKHLEFCNPIYVDCNKREDSWQDMYLMSQCKHNIIANSSFSWWGAWLNKNPQKVVIFPSKFMNQGLSQDIISKSWIKI